MQTLLYVDVNVSAILYFKAFFTYKHKYAYSKTFIYGVGKGRKQISKQTNMKRSIAVRV